jgi:hypothetical protein
MTRHFKRRLLERAAEIVGDNDRLSLLLDVDRHALEFWLSGRATLPQRVFSSAMDIVLRDDVARAAQDRRARPRQPQPLQSRV